MKFVVAVVALSLVLATLALGVAAADEEREKGWGAPFLHVVELDDAAHARMQASASALLEHPADASVRSTRVEVLTRAHDTADTATLAKRTATKNAKREAARRARFETASHKRQSEGCSYSTFNEICDDPEVRNLYGDAAARWTPDVNTTVFELRFVSTADNDGSNATITPETAQQQVDILNSIFFNLTTLNTARIRFNYSIETFHREEFRYKYLLRGVCNREEVSNDVTDEACMSAITGFDHGQHMCAMDDISCNTECRTYNDFLRRDDCPCICREEFYRCPNEVAVPGDDTLQRLSNRMCDDECNWFQYDWDGGDCCGGHNSLNPTIQKDFKCKNVENQWHNWIDEDSFGFSYPAQRDGLIYVFATPVAPDLFNAVGGWAIQLKDKASLHPTNVNGAFVDTEHGYFGLGASEAQQGKTLVRLIAELFNVFPVDQGTTGLLNTETPQPLVCADACYERQARTALSNFTGDLVEDTLPVPRVFTDDCATDLENNCGAPADQDLFCVDCLGNPYDQDDTTLLLPPQNNYLNYNGERCRNSFTPQQIGRLFCYSDILFRDDMKQGQRVPGPIIFPPVATAVNDSGTILVEWIAPYMSGHPDPNVPLDYFLERDPPYESLVRVVAEEEFVDRTVDPGEFYRYRVRALNEFGAGIWSPWSNEAGGLRKTCRCRPWPLNMMEAVDRIRFEGC